MTIKLFRLMAFILALSLVVTPVSAMPPLGLSTVSNNSSDILQLSNSDPLPQVDPELLTQLTRDESSSYLIYFRDKADLSPAYQMDWENRGVFVMEALLSVAEASQMRVREYLDQQGAQYKPYWIDNVIVVQQSDMSTFNGLLSFSEIEILRAEPEIILFESELFSVDENTILAIEANINHVNAPDVWALGFDGQGITVASIDTGVRYTHQALVEQYRGNLGGGSFNHNHNWWNPYESSSFPSDSHDHGSHVTGTMVGDDGGSNQIGMAPGADWIACRGFNPSATSAGLLECGQFMAAPWDLDGLNPNSSLRPHVVNNSWGSCQQAYDPWYQGIIDSWHAAGVIPIFANGNASNCGYSSPPGLNTVGNPARYGNVTGVGSTGTSNGQYANHSNWGPTDNPDTVNPNGFPTIKPQVVAPGVSIRSSLRGSDSSYGTMTGTSMSAPHVAGLIALIWQAAPWLIGDYSTTETIIQDTATPIPYDTGNGDEGPGNVPNHATGWGEINALAAVQAAIALGDTGTLEGTVTVSGTGEPIAGAEIEADGPATQTTTTNASGEYSLLLPEGTYQVTATAFGFLSQTVSGVDIQEDETTTLDFSLSSAPTYQVSGTVTDMNTGWPLYASIEIDGFPGDPVWTNPLNGEYEILLAGDIAYTFHVTAWVDGYLTESRAVGPLVVDLVENFALDVDIVACTAPGYLPTFGFFDDFESGYDSWTMGGLWNTQSQSDTCGALVAPFPSPVNAAYYGDEVACNFDVGTNSGSLTMVDPVSIPAEGASLTYWSFEETECGGNCSWDKRYTEVSIDGGSSWITIGEGNTENTWHQRDFDLSAYGGENLHVRFRFNSIDGIANNYFGWMVDDIAISTGCEPQAGSLVVGNVYDANTADALTGASVENDAGYSTTTEATPLDPAVDDGFFTLFAPEGTVQFTASMTGNYAPNSVTLVITDGQTVAQDFFLQAGYLQANPESLEVTVGLGGMFTLPLELNNMGGVTAVFEIRDIDGGFNPMVAIAGQTWSYSQPAQIGPTSVRSPEGRAELQRGSVDNTIAWTGAASLPAGDGVVRYGHAQCADDPESFYVIAGVNEAFSVTNKTWRYDAITDEWTPLANLPTGQEGPSAVCYEGYIYVLGGGGTNQFYIYDIAADDWSSAPALPRNMWGAAVGAYNGYIYMIGGDDDFSFGGTSNQVNIYDIAAGSWIGTGAVMPTAAVTPGFAQAGQYLYLVGGWNDGSPAQNVDQTQRYDMTSDNWELGPTFTSARSDLPLAITETYLYAIGGDASGGGAFDATSVVEKLDHTNFPAGSWEATTSLPGPLSAHKGGFCTETFTGGEVWSTGGYSGASVVATNQYEPAENCFSEVTGVPWLSTDPESGTVTAMGTQSIDVTFDASVPEVDQPGIYTAILRFINDTPYGHLDVPVTMIVVADADYGIELDPTEADQSGDPGDTVEYTLTLTNTGNVTDIILLTLSGNNWDVFLSETSFLLDPGASAEFTVQVEIPADAPGGSSDSLNVTATSSGDGSVTATAVLTTSIKMRFIYMPIVVK